MAKNVYDTINLQKVMKICQLTVTHQWLTLLQGESGFGKTLGFKYFALKNKNVFLVQVEAADKRNYIGPWQRLAIQVLGEEFYYKNCEHVKFAHLIDFIIAGLNASPERKLVVIDEGGSLGEAMLRQFRNLTDRTRKTTGWILGGPNYFVDNLNGWIKQKVQGMAELETRIDCICSLMPPDDDDKKFICAQEGVEESAIPGIVKKSTNFRTLFREINNYKNNIPSRYENEWYLDKQTGSIHGSKKGGRKKVLPAKAA